MGELGVLFNPGMRHEQEEKLAKQMLREDEGTGRKGRMGIDLESGVVVIGSDAQQAAEPELDRADSSGESNGSATTTGAPDGDTTTTGDSPDGNGASQPPTPDPAAPTDPVETPPRPGEPHVARRTSSAVPSGKSRRHRRQAAGG